MLNLVVRKETAKLYMVNHVFVKFVSYNEWFFSFGLNICNDAQVQQSISKSSSTAKVRRQNVLYKTGHGNTVYKNIVGFISCPMGDKLLMT